MTVTVHISAEAEKWLRKRTAESGQTAEAVLNRLIEQEAGIETAPEAKTAARTFDEILAPIRQGFQERGLSEDELMALLGEAREEVWQERQKTPGSR